jgi:hypothetical protein
MVGHARLAGRCCWCLRASPAATFVLVAVLVLRFIAVRVPGGLLRAEAEQDKSDSAAEEVGGASEDDEDV